jgi:excisionase family DNA binding protein
VCSLRHTHGIPVFDPQAAVTPSDDDGEVVTIYQAERILGVDHSTIYRWLHSGFIEGEQLAAGGPWRLRITDGLRRRIVPEVPDGWLPLDQAAKALGVARQTVLHKVQRGELEAVHVSRGKRKGLRIKVFGDSPGLFATTE